MTSGIDNYSEDVAFNRSLDANPKNVWTIPQLLDLGYACKPYFKPGGGFHYSNTNTVILGLMAVRLTGMPEPLAELFRTRIFQPLGMTGTSLPAAADWTIPKPSPRAYMYGTNVGHTSRVRRRKGRTARRDRCEPVLDLGRRRRGLDTRRPHHLGKSPGPRNGDPPTRDAGRAPPVPPDGPGALRRWLWARYHGLLRRHRPQRQPAGLLDLRR